MRNGTQDRYSPHVLLIPLPWTLKPPNPKPLRLCSRDLSASSQALPDHSPASRSFQSFTPSRKAGHLFAVSDSVERVCWTVWRSGCCGLRMRMRVYSEKRWWHHQRRLVWWRPLHATPPLPPPSRGCRCLRDWILWHPDLTEVVIDFCPGIGIGIQLMMGRSMPIVELFGMDGWRTCHPHSHSLLVLEITVTRHCFCPILIWFVNFRSGSSGSVGRG